MALIFGDQLTRHALEATGLSCSEILARGCLLDSVRIGFKVDMKGRTAAVDVPGHAVALQYRVKIPSDVLSHLVGSSNRLSCRHLLQNDDAGRGCQGRCIKRAEMNHSLEAVVPRIIVVVKKL